MEMQSSKIVIYFVFLMMLSCNGEAQKSEPKVKSEIKNESINFFDKKYESALYSLIIDESNISDHPIKSFIDCKNEGYFTLHYIPKTEDIKKFWMEDFYGSTDLENIDLENDDQKIHTTLKGNLRDYAVFSYQVNKEFLDSNGECNEESTFATKNTVAKIYYYNPESKIWTLIKKINSEQLPPYHDIDFFTKNFPQYFLSSTADTKKQAKMWNGNYSLALNYGKLDEFSEMSIDYDIEITGERCTFSGLGYKTYFTDLCKMEENGNQLILKFIKTIDGDGFSDHSKLDVLAEITFKNNKYYIKSPIIADTDWKYNSELFLEKK